MIGAQGTALVIEGRPPAAVPPGTVIVARHATPDFAILFPHVLGAVFETGGVACHAAILAREFCTPCMVGVEGAMAAVSSGERVVLLPHDGMVEVHAH